MKNFATVLSAVLALSSICDAETAIAKKVDMSSFVKRVHAPAKPPANVQFAIDGETDGFTIKHDENSVQITAGKLENLAPGYGYYLKNHLGCHWSWDGKRMQPVTDLLSKKLPASINVPEQWSWRYAYNYCTLSYTMAFWTEKEWEKEIDRMALNGMVQMLIQAGLEKVWQLTLQDIGYPKESIAKFIPAPSSAAWWNMGNLDGHGGPLTQKQIDDEAKIGKFIAKRMLELGMQPVLQGFVGLVPHDLGKYYTKNNAKYIQQGNWCDGFQRPFVLDPTSDAFQDIAAIWYKNIKIVYGFDAKYFGGDLFHEGGNSRGINITQAAKSVQTAMQKANPNSTWVIQAWGGNPSGALLNGLDNDKAIVLHLTQNLKSGADGKSIRKYNGKPWVWCELLNFGGNQGMYGSLKLLAGIASLQTAPAKDILKGLGLISEGVETNPIFYDLFYDRFWIDKNKNFTPAELNDWIADYTCRRFGVKNENLIEAFKILERSVYSPSRMQEGTTESILCASPGRSVNKASRWSSAVFYYDSKDVLLALDKMIKAAEENPELMKIDCFKFDLVDVARQYLSEIARPLLAQSMAAYDNNDLAEYDKLSKQFLSLITMTDSVLATHTMWNFGRMFEMAERKNMGTQAKNLVTIWGRKVGSLNDYAHRQMAGLMGKYYLTRWTIFFDTYRQALVAGKDKLGNVAGNARTKIVEFENKWFTQKDRFSAKPKGDALTEAKKIVAAFGDFHFPKTTGEKWTLNDGASEFVFNVTDDITSTGKYSAAFQYQNGRNALIIESVSLYEGDKLVAEDKHEGWTGSETRNNVYVFTVSELRKNLTTYTIKAKVKGSGGKDSSGVMIFNKMK